MHIGIDIKNYALYHSGIFNATFPLISELIRKRPDISFTLVGPAKGFVPFVGLPNCRHLPIQIPRVRRGEYLYNFLSFPLGLRKVAFDLFYSPYFDLWLPGRIPFVVSLHDMLHYRLPELYHPLLRTYLRRVQKRNARLARHIFTISECSKRDIVDYLGIPAEKVTVMIVPINEAFLEAAAVDPEAGSEMQQETADRTVVLYSGGVEHRKNLVRLLEAFAGLPEEFLLVMTGKKEQYSKYRQWLEQLERKNQLWLCGFLETAELRRLYHRCDLIVYPSLWEGFGYPIIEAMAVKKPIACSRLSSLPEVGGDYPVYLDPYSIDDIRRSIREGVKKKIPADFPFPDQYRLSNARRVFLTAFEKLLVPG